jgi:penicillin amidase
MTTLQNIQFDATLERAAALLPVVAAAHPSTQDGALLESRIVAWDQQCPPESSGCAAYEAFEYRLLRGLFDDELGGLARDYVGGSASLETAIGLLGRPDDPWWDDVGTTGTRETRDDIVAAALDEAGRELRAAVGDPDKWTWGALHQAHFDEATLGSSGIGPLEWYFNQGPFAASGAAGAVNNTYSRISRAYPDAADPSVQPVGIDHVFDVTNLPAFRFSIDLADLDGARVIQTTGQSGNPFDRHYADFIGPWLRGDTVSLPFSLGEIHAATVETLQLVPPAAP